MKERTITYLGFVVVTVSYIVCSNGSINIALTKNTVQSSIKFNGKSELAVDGNRNPYFENGSCIHTASDTSIYQWWMVDLEVIINITEIVVYSRQDPCCSTWLFNFTIDGGVNGNNGTIDFLTCYTNTEVLGPVKNFTLSNCTARYVRIRRIQNFKPVVLCEVEVYGSLIVSAQNIALNKNTKQISTNHGGESSRAVDGNKNQLYTGRSCTHTQDTNDSDWWQVDLGNTFNVTEVAIYGRNENCCDAWLYNFTIDAGLYINNSTIDYLTCYTQIPSMGVQKTFELHNCSARYIRIRQMVNPSPLILCEVEVFGEILFSASSINATNIALRKNTEQVSTNHDGYSHLAVDGNKNQFFIGKSCTHTKDNDGPDWWQVDLVDTYNVTEVVIYGRIDICCDFWLFNFTIEGGVDGCNNTINFKSCYTQTEDMGIVKSFLLSNCSARYIRIRQILNMNPLNLCEVEVYGILESPPNLPCLGIESSTVSSSSGATSILLQDLSSLTTSSNTMTALPSSIVVASPYFSINETSQTLTEPLTGLTMLSSDVTDYFEDLYTSSDSYVISATFTQLTFTTSVWESPEHALTVTPTSITSTSHIMQNTSVMTKTVFVDYITATTSILESSSTAKLDILLNSTSMTTQYVDNCRCRCTGSYDKFLEEIIRLQKLLTINTTGLSSKIRKRISINDERLSAMSIGYTGVAILVAFFGLFILNDVLTFLNFAYNMLYKVR